MDFNQVRRILKKRLKISAYPSSTPVNHHRTKRKEAKRKGNDEKEAKRLENLSPFKFWSCFYLSVKMWRVLKWCRFWCDFEVFIGCKRENMALCVKSVECGCAVACCARCWFRGSCEISGVIGIDRSLYIP